MGAWIETDQASQKSLIEASHPTWVRGLKLAVLASLHPNDMSHHTWVRGLKLWCNQLEGNALIVALYVGAWIETTKGGTRPRIQHASYPSGCVD